MFLYIREGFLRVGETVESDNIRMKGFIFLHLSSPYHQEELRQRLIISSSMEHDLRRDIQQNS